MPCIIAPPDVGAVQQQLTSLTRTYPAFRFSHEAFGWKGTRWVAERRDPTAAGLRLVITGDLAELLAALAADRDNHGR